MNNKRLVFAISLTALAGLGWTTIARPNHSSFLSGFPSIKNSVRAFKSLSETSTAAVHSGSLSRARVSYVANNRVVITMDAVGDLPGALTLMLDRDGSGRAVVGGNWALVVAEIPPADNHQDNGNDHGGPSDQPIQKGTLSGTVSSGSISFSAEGKLASIDTLQLHLNLGSQTFKDVSTGSGSVQVVNVENYPLSSGSISLSF